MRVALIAILWIGVSGSLPAQTVAPATKTSSGRPEKKSQALSVRVPIFRDIAAVAGLTASHISSREKYYVIESMSGGVGLSTATTTANSMS